MKILFKIFILSFLVIHSVFARFATKDDCDIEYEFYNRDIDIKIDGLYEEVIEQQIKLLNERGRDSYGTFSFTYNHDTMKLQILEAYTILNGKKIKVSKKMIEDKPYGPKLIGFDSLHRVIISYPQAEVGATLYLKYKKKAFKIALKNFYNGEGYWGVDGFWNKSNLNLRSRLPLYTIINDPYNSLEVNQKFDKGLHIIAAKLKKPISYDLFNEYNTILDDNKKTWIKISSLNKHEDLILKNAPKYEKVIYSKLPDAYQKIVNEAQKISNEVHQINYVTSKVNEIIRYMGDWRTIEGGLFPRMLTEVVKTGFGDCKDFASSTAAILYNLGYNVNAVWVLRGEGLSRETKILPSFYLHNHAILKAVAKSGKEYFIDPTNFVSMADGIFPDIAGKMVYILDSKNPRVEQIEDIDYKHSVHKKYSTMKSGNGFIKVEGAEHMIGETAAFLTGKHLLFSQKALEDSAINFISGDVACTQKKIYIPNLTSRIVNDIIINYEFKKIDHRTKTNLGKVFTLNMPETMEMFIDITDDREGDLYVGPPVTIKSQITIVGANIKNLSKLDCNIKTNFMNFQRKVIARGNNAVIEYNFELVRGYILNQELKTAEYKKFRDDLKREFSIGVVSLN